MTSRTSDELLARAWQGIANTIVAHLTMLRDVSILDNDALDALQGSIASVRQAPLNAQSLQAMITVFDERMDALAPPEVRGTGQVGRGTNDVIATVVRLILREDVLGLVWATNTVRGALIDQATSFLVALLPAYAGGQPAQPTTFAHLLGSVISPLERATSSLGTAVNVINSSPMGAVSLVSTSLEIDPARTGELLGFSGSIENSFDAVASVDHVVVALDAAKLAIAPIARLFDELLAWLRIQSDALQFEDQSVGKDAALPQLAMPTMLQTLSRDANMILRNLDSVRSAVDSIPFGPVVGADADTLLRTSDAISQSISFQELAAEFVSNQLNINRAVLANRAGKGLVTSSDLSDFLMLEEQLPPFAAQAIAHRVIAMARDEGREASGITPELIDSAALLIVGRELRVEFETISRYLAPRRFIERRTLPGGPAPTAMREYLERARARLEKDQNWQADTADRIGQSLRSLDVAVTSSGG
jgi:argininosuccinate lyase